MNRIDERFKELKSKNSRALITFLTCGYPDMETTEKLIYSLVDNGIDMIELGVPFSDPIADGPIIQYSSQMALKNNVSLKNILDLSKRLRKKVEIPLLIMGYLNSVYRFGIEKFFYECSSVGIDGVIIPDMALEESIKYRNILKNTGVHVISFIAPNTEEKRRREIINNSHGFIYIVSVTGVTGIRKEFSADLKNFLNNIRMKTEKPLVVGFGISNPAQVKEIFDYIDGFIIGSALIDIIMKSDKKILYNRITKFIRPFVGIKNG